MVATETPARAALSDEQLTHLLALMKGADSVELKMTVPDPAHRSTVMNLGMEPLDAQIRQVFFFDTPDLTLNNAGVVVRARRVQGKRADSTIKLRPVVPSELPVELRRSPDFSVEVDAMPGGFVCSGSLKNLTDNQLVREAAAGKLPIRKLFSKEQRRLFEAHSQGLTLDELELLGPIFVLKLKWQPQGQPRSMTGEMWLYPDGSRILELSTKCAPGEAFQVAAEARAYLAEHGISVTGEQSTKTKKALEFFSQLPSRGAA